MDRLLTPLAKILFAQKYHADSKEWVDKEWLEISDNERWLLTKRAETLLPFFDEAVSLISDEYIKRIQVLEASLNDVKNQVEQVRKETAEDIFKLLDKNGDRGYYDNLFTIGLQFTEYKDLKSKYGIK
jgi:hypothetical protein